MSTGGGRDKRSTAWKKKRNEQKKQSPREPESSSRFRNGHSAPKIEDLRKKSTFPFRLSKATQVGDYPGSKPSRYMSESSGFFYIPIFMLNIFATCMFQTDLISQAKLRPLPSCLRPVSGPSRKHWCRLCPLYISRLPWIVLQNASSARRLATLQRVSSSCFFVLTLHTLWSRKSLL